MGQGHSEAQDGTRTLRGLGWNKYAQRLRMKQGRKDAQGGTRHSKAKDGIRTSKGPGWVKDAQRLKIGQERTGFIK